MLVDTSAWIEFLRGTGSEVDVALTAALRDDTFLAVSGVILQEVQQGFRTRTQADDFRRLVAGLRSVEPVYPETYEHAATLYRRCREAGCTVRGTVDCLIGALAIEHRLPLLSHDRDLVTLAEVCGIKLWARA